ncbi:serine hydrolase [Robiginitalea sp. SC105]|uniref:serine hydrolase domain-containing protein n=1 Tax=Robiginitalea sp. SC105 TaxID=2762332 RepID=UPI00163A8C4A|nr:serine hydrolase domain-containing protein [Robiginitalea sp. SC105]MBC2839653.1 beta-lactamase family protein [Robiginitalea sp. SC105]
MKYLMLAMGLIVSAGVYSQDGNFPEARKEAVKSVMKKHISQGIPGLALTVYTRETGYWSHAEGVSNLGTVAPLTPDNLFYLQSVSKLYMAVTILHLEERGQIDLEDPITRYLNYPWLEQLDGIEKVTVRMLLNHTSGLPEYSTEPRLVSRIIQDPRQVLSPEEMLPYISGHPMDFAPGSRYAYRNTNYALLALIADQITGDHRHYMKTHILKPQGLQQTHILDGTNYMDIEGITSSYWDVLLEGKPVDISILQRANVASMKGDDGLVASTRDAVDFLKALVLGKILKPGTLKLMQDWVTNENGDPVYGLGLARYDLDVTYAIGHSGGGVGAGCVLLYLPDLDAIVFLATNFNTMMDSPIRRANEDLQMNLLLALFTD